MTKNAVDTIDFEIQDNAEAVEEIVEANAVNEATLDHADAKGPDTPTADDLKKLRQSLRNKAEREIITRHQAEYHDVAQALFEAEGLVYTKRMTAEEKAAAELRAAIQANPDLAREILAQG